MDGNVEMALFFNYILRKRAAFHKRWLKSINSQQLKVKWYVPLVNYRGFFGSHLLTRDGCHNDLGITVFWGAPGTEIPSVLGIPFQYGYLVSYFNFWSI